MRLNLLNTYTVLILADSVFALPFCTWMLKSYFDTIPWDLEEAAMLDGCNRPRALVRVVLPLMSPGLVATGTWAFLSAWNEFMFAVTLTNDVTRSPITVGIAEFFDQFTMNWNAIMAVATAASVPLMIFFIFFQRYVVQGLAEGAVK